MSAIIISVEGVSVKPGSGKPKLLVRGRRRKACKKLLQALTSMFNQDLAEERRATNIGYNPFLVLGATNSKFNKALNDLNNRMVEVLNAKS